MIDALVAAPAGSGGSGGGDGRGAVRVKADVEWPTYDGRDIY
jgi:hypothetical protein